MLFYGKNLNLGFEVKRMMELEKRKEKRKRMGLRSMMKMPTGKEGVGLKKKNGDNIANNDVNSKMMMSKTIKYVKIK